MGWLLTKGGANAVLLSFLLLSTNSASANEWRVDFGRVGLIKIGMSAFEYFKIFDVVGNIDDECQSYGLLMHDNMSLDTIMFADRKIVDISIKSKKYRMSNGVGVGSRWEDIQNIYRKSVKHITYNQYTANPQVIIEPPIEVIKKFSKNLPISIQFEFEYAEGRLTKDSKVESISIGEHPIEGCS
jgi:hypothetical protein